MKPCFNCGVAKALELFPAGKNSCKVCVAVYKAKHRLKTRIAKWGPSGKAPARKIGAESKSNALRCSRDWKSRNPGAVLAYANQRRAAKLRAAPAWADKAAIKEAYKLAKLRSAATGIEYHVDHIIPLRGALVCGLHVENNLQVIPAIVNRRKHNKLIEIRSGWGTLLMA
jgi:hypothetical protein